MMSKKLIFILSFFMILLCVSAASASDNADDIMEEAVFETPDEAVSIENIEPIEDVGEESLAVQYNETIIFEDDDGIYLDPTEAYECLNEYRAEKGAWYWDIDDTHVIYYNTRDTNQLKPLEIDLQLEQAAKIRAKEISQLFEHTRPDGTDWFTVYPNEGFWTHGENIARFYPTGKYATEAWKENFLPFSEQGHRRNMLSPNYNCIGIAGYYSPSLGYYWVQAFGLKLVEENNTKNTTFDNTKATFNELNTLIKTGSEIILEKDYVYNESDTINGIIIDRNIVIDGCEHTIDGKKMARIFNITADNVVLKNIRFTNGYADYDCGGAIYSTSSKLSIINCSFDENFAYYGGAIYSTGSLELTDSQINDNLAVEGVIYSKDCKVNITNCDFKSNMAILYGGAASLTDCEMNIENSKFSENTGYQGGTVYSIRGKGSIKDSSFSSNTAVVQGGSLYLKTPVTVENCDFTKNVANSNVHPEEGGGAIYINASSANIKKCNFNENRVNLYGGAVFLSSGTLSIEDCHFIKNQLSTGGYGNHGGAIYSTGDIKVLNSEFKANTADNAGAISSKGGQVIIKNSEISQSQASKGGAILAENSYVELENCLFTNNRGEYGGVLNLEENSASIINCKFSNNTAEMGGCLYLKGNEFTIECSNFTDNRGNATWIANGGAIYLLSGKISVEKSRFINNTLTAEEYTTRGGAIFSSDVNMDISECIFEKNNANDGGDIYSLYSDVKCTSCDFSKSESYIGASIFSKNGNFTVTNSDIHSNNPISGSIYSNNSTLTVTDSRFYENKAKNSGSAICTDLSTVNIDRCEFENNTKDSVYSINGGSITCHEGTVNVRESNFKNGATDNGGAIFVINANLTLENCCFENNTANATYSSIGGAVSIHESNARVIGCSFNDNNVFGEYEAEGGSIYSRNTKLTVENTQFSRANAKTGAAIFATRGNVEVKYCHIKDICTEEAGAINLEECTASITDSTFTNTSTYYKGGAIRFEKVNGTVENCRFENSTSYWGGAVFSMNGEITLKNSNFTNNTAQMGGAVYGCDAVDCIFTGNYAETSGAIYGENNIASNCRFIENTAFYGNPTSGVEEKNCVYKDNVLLKRATIQTYYLYSEYYQKDTIYVPLMNENYESVDNITITAKAYKNNAIIKEFEFISKDGLKLDIEDGEYLFKFSVENPDYIVEPVNATITVLKKDTADVTITIKGTTYPQTVTAEFMSNVDGNIELYINDTYIDEISVTANKISSKSLANIPAGKHSIKAYIIPSNSIIDPEIFSSEFEVYKKQTDITLDIADCSNDENVIVNITASEDGNAVVKIGKITKNIHLNANNIFQIDFGKLNAGQYDVEAKFTAGSNYIDSEAKKTLKISTKISQEDIKITKPENKTDISIDLPADAGGKVTVTIAGKTYETDVVNGKTYVKLPDLNGNNPYTITYSGDDKYSGFNISGTLNSEKPTVKQDIEDIKFNNVNDIILPKDASGTMTLTINGHDYIFDVVNGISGIKMPELEDSTYKYTVRYSGDNKYSSFEITQMTTVKNPVVIDASDRTVTYASNAYYTITVKGVHGKAVNNCKAIIYINGKAFKTLPVNDGVCKFKVSQAPGTYRLNITVKDSSIAAKLTVKHLLKISTVKVKKSAKKLVLSATLGKVNKKYLKGKKITFKFNGKKYSAKTNKKGVAKVTIKSSVLKKLKIGKKITYQATYSKDTVKKTTKVKK